MGRRTFESLYGMLYVRYYSHALDVIVKHVCFKSIYLRDALSEIFS